VAPESSSSLETIPRHAEFHCGAVHSPQHGMLRQDTVATLHTVPNLTLGPIFIITSDVTKTSTGRASIILQWKIPALSSQPGHLIKTISLEDLVTFQMFWTADINPYPANVENMVSS